MPHRQNRINSRTDAIIATEEHSAIDVTTGHGVDSFLSDAIPEDPWARHCFQQTIDALVNNRELCYPFPTRQSVERGNYRGLGQSLFALQDAGLVRPATTIVAEADRVTEHELLNTLACFDAWARGNTADLAKWIRFHRTAPLIKRHKTQISGDVHPAVRAFWAKYRSEATRLAKVVSFRSSHLRYAFDVAHRGRQYMILLAEAGIPYFPHPIRRRVLWNDEHTTYKFAASWSWGRFFATQVRSGRLPSNIDELIPLLATLKTKVRRTEATPGRLSSMPDTEKKKRIISVAAECGLPARVKDTVCRSLERAVSFADILLYGLPDGHLVGAHLSLAIGALALQRELKVHGSVAKHLPFIRGFIDYPGLFEDDD